MGGRHKLARLLPAIILILAAAALPAIAGPRGNGHSGKSAGSGYAPDRIIVKFVSDTAVVQGPKGDVTTELASVKKLNARFGVKNLRPVFRRVAKGRALPPGLEKKIAATCTLTFSAKADPRAVAREYSKLPDVEYAEPDYIRHSTRLDPNDPFWLSNNSWGQNYRDQWDMEIMKCPDAWDLQTGSPNLVIAVVDTGMDYNHADIAANIWSNPSEIPGNGLDDDGNGRIDDYHGYDFVNKDGDPMDDNGHGTHVAGTIGAVGNNGIGMAGVNWACKLMALKGLDSAGNGYDSDLADAITYAASEGAAIINMSWGGTGYSQTIHAAIAYAHGQGAVLCAAAGNSGSDLANFHPASDNYVITVTASDTSDAACSFTNWGIKASVSAPGGNGSGSSPPCAAYNCLSLRAGTRDPLLSDCGPGVGIVAGSYYRLGGTSMACPHVAGLAGLVRVAHPTWSNEQIRQAIQMRADDILSAGFDRFSGFGRVNAYSTLTTNEPLTAFISSPVSGSEVSGAVSIQGTAAGPGFSQWTLDYGPGQEPASWTTIQTGIAPVSRSTLATWDVSGITGGLYTLRLRATGTGSVQDAEYRMAITPKSTEGSGHLTELFDTAPFDLAYKSLEFVPDGSSKFYSMCVRSITQLPTDSSGGTTLTLDDDASVLVTLGGAAQVSLYGNVRNQFFVGSNGYITFDAGDSSYTETYSNHFNLKRISALFDDLVMNSGGISWKQLSDRVAVTYLNLSEYGASTPSTFQIEMYYDGRIAISFLNVAAADGLTGLSAGLGVPSGFVESNLSGYPNCVVAGRALSVVKPNGGECYEPGSTARVIWSYTGTSWKPADTVHIDYSTNSGATWTPISGAQSLPHSAGSYDWQTSGYPQSDYYRVRVTLDGDDLITDQSNTDFTVGPDIVPPTISHAPLADTSTAAGPYDIYADVTDNLGIASATLYWNKNGGPFTAAVMGPSGGTGRYHGAIPGPSVVGDSYCYYIEATDSSSAHNVGRLPLEAGQSFCFSVVERSDYLTEFFGTAPFDLDNLSIEFTPDGSNSFYSVCTHPITELPTDPAGGTLVPLGDDNYIEVSLTGGKQVSLYGESAGSFFVGSNGYITFERGDSNWTVNLENHFAFKRISALFADLYPSDNVTYSQLQDRVAVTYDDIREYGATNASTFQVEMFYNGKITISCMDVSLDDAIVGLSAGNGMPVDFVQSDLSAYPCGPRLTVVQPDGGEFYEPGQMIPIAWTAIGSGWQPGDSVRLEVSADGGSTWEEIPGADTLAYDEGAFEWFSAGWPLSARYRVRIVSNRDAGVNDASDGDFSIAVDTTPPEIAHTPLTDTSNTEGPYRLSAQVTDNLGVASATLYWSRNGAPFAAVPMVSGGTDEYWGDISGPGVSCEDTFCYYIVATDASAAHNSVRSPESGSCCFEIAGPDIGVSTTAMMFELPPGGTGSQDLVISNDGCVPLQWQITERSASGMIYSQAAARAPGEHPGIDWSAPHHPGRLIVGFEPAAQVAQRASVHAQAGAKVMRSFGIVSADLVRVDAGADLKSVAAKYASLPGVAYVEPDYTLSAAGIPDDSMFSSQWGMHNTGQTGGTPDADVDAPETWDILTGSADVIVAVIDTGVCYTHPDLAANMWVNTGEVAGNGIDDDENGLIDDCYGYDYANNDGNPMDDNEHGTHVAGVIGAVGANGVGVAGLNWNTRIMALKFLRSDGRGDTSNAVLCLEYAVSKGAKLSCNSWGGGAYSTTLYNAIAAAGEAGHLFVAAAGNTGVDTDSLPYYPSCYSHGNIISVAATNAADSLAVWPSGGGSNWGLNTVDLAAPGLGILSTVPSTGYASLDGTSMAAPFVAGACALCMSVNPDATREQIKQWILGGVDENPALTGKMVTGGRLNVHSSVLLAGIPWLDETPKSGVVPPGESRTITISASAVGLSDGLIDTGSIAIQSNDFATPSTVVSVTLNVVLAGRFLRLDSPNGDEWYQPGAVVPVKWTPIGTDWQPSDLVKLQKSTDGGTTWTQIAGATGLGCAAGTFNWDTAGCPSSSKYRVRVVFVNNEGISDGSDDDFTVAPDMIPPVINHSPLADSGDMSGPYTVYAGVTDNYGVGGVTLYWQKNGGMLNSAPMSATGTDNQYSAQIPGPSLDGDHYCYYIRAVDSSAAGNVAVLPTGAPSELLCFTARSLVNLPANLDDGEGYRWDIQQNGSISDGTSDSFDGGFVLSGFPNVPSGGLEDGGREIVISNGSSSGIQVSRKVYVPENRAYCRILEVVTNLTDSPANHTVRVDSNLGSDSATVIVGTSDGDTAFEPADQWIVTDDVEGSGDPVVVHVISGPGASVPPSSVSYTVGSVGYQYDLSLAPLETKIVMHFGSQRPSRASGLLKAAGLAAMSPDEDCLAGMTSQERAQVANFTITGRSLDIVSPNGGQWYEPGSVVPITWAFAGSDWQAGDTVRLETSSDGGANWALIPAAAALPYGTGSFDWNTGGATPSDSYRVRVTLNGSDAVRDESDGVFVIAADNIPPTISHTPLADTNDLVGPYRISAQVNDNALVSVVTLYWRLNGGQFFSVPMSPSGQPDEYFANIPGPALDGDRFCYYISATDSSALGNTTVEPNGAPGETHCFTVCHVVNLPIYLYDSESFVWDIQQNGSILIGQNDAFDGAFALNGFPNITTGRAEDGDREIVISDGAVAGIQVTRKVYVPSDRAYARFLEIVTNNSDSPAQHLVRIDTNLGSDAETVVVGTSDGDPSLETGDQWIVTDDADAIGDPSIAHVIAGAAAPQRPTLAAVTGDLIRYEYQLSLAPHETRIVMHFGVQSLNRAAALTRAQQLALVDAAQNCLFGMTVQERAQVVNFVTSGMRLEVKAPNGGETCASDEPIPVRWNAIGPDWKPGDTVRIEFSSNQGSAWAVIPGAGSIAHNGQFNWTPTGVSGSDGCMLRVVRNGDASVSDASDGPFTIFAAGGALSSKLHADGVPVAVKGMRVSGVYADRFYVQDEHRSCGIGILWPGEKPALGGIASVRGTMTTMDGERLINASDVTWTDPDALAPIPIGMSCGNLGGGGLSYSAGPPPMGQQGIAGKVGLNNIGLLVKVWGRVTSVDASAVPSYFTMTDGFGEVLVDMASAMDAPDVDDQVSVTGISACYLVGSELRSRLRMRLPGDMIDHTRLQ